MVMRALPGFFVFSVLHMLQAVGSGQDLARHIKGAVRAGGESPFDQRDPKIADLDARDAPWMHAASCVAVGDGSVEHGTVCMSCDQHARIPVCPVGQNAFHLLLLGIILRGAGRIKETGGFQRFPDIPDQKPGGAPQDAVEEIRLMAVGQIDLPAGCGVGIWNGLLCTAAIRRISCSAGGSRWISVPVIRYIF